MIDSVKTPLRWKRAATWNLSQQPTVLFTAKGGEVEYVITRAGTADKPSWGLYTRHADGMEECWCVSNLLREIKSYAQDMELGKY